MSEPQEQLTFLDEPAAGEYEIPEFAEPAVCKSCDAAIVWAKTTSGASIPLDLQTVRIIAGRRYARTHFATCPHSKQWRRRQQTW